MKFYYSVSTYKSLDIEALKAVLPAHFSVTQENGDTLLVVEQPDLVPADEDSEKESVLYEIERECDRIFFLTGVILNPTLKRLERSDASGTGFAYVRLSAYVVDSLKPDILPQTWQEPLERQLALWRFADSVPIPIKVNLLFQIIEAKYPDTTDQRIYPPYLNHSVSPHPRTEAKLLRDFVSHQKYSVMTQLGNYCRYIGVSEGFFNPLNPDHVKIVKSKVNIVSALAKKIIDETITRKKP